LSIVAEMQAVFAGASREPLRARRVAIHDSADAASKTRVAPLTRR
jgi:hypothetical protein